MKSQPKLEAEMTHAASTQSNLLMPSLALGCGCGGRKQGRAQRGLGNYSAGAQSQLPYRQQAGSFSPLPPRHETTGGLRSQLGSHLL